MSKIRESEVVDKRGNVLISKGLKVRHKSSRFEYSVDSIMKDKDGSIIILLKSPEEPRVAPQGSKGKAPIIDKAKVNKMIYDVDLSKDLSDSYYEPEESEPASPDDLIVVKQQKFEKEYEVV